VHELSLCANLIEQLEQLAVEAAAAKVGRIELKIGVLSGVEPQLMAAAFGMAQVGTIAENAALFIEVTQPVIHCHDCNHEGEVSPQNLLCPHCGSESTELVAGHELILARVELLGSWPDARVNPL
jgi:hydrogenase nickel incorporation protein HypA/HybF